MPKKDELGRALIKQHRQNSNFKNINSTIIPDTHDWCRLPVKSITQESSLDEFFNIATISNFEFCKTMQQTKIISSTLACPMINRVASQALIDKYKDQLILFERPCLSLSLTTEERDAAEKKAYVEWRLSLSKLERIGDIAITPYEKNLVFWRQLWIVLEKSDVLVQVVDARQPLLFYSDQLVNYIKKLNPAKKTLILVNKSDLLTEKQRELWSKYFDSLGVRVLFFSAICPKARLKESDLASQDETEVVVDTQTNEAKDSVTVDNLKMCADFHNDLITNSDDEDGDQSTVCNSSFDDCENELTNEIKQTACLTTYDLGWNLLSVDELIDVLAASGSPVTVGNNVLTVGFVGFPNVGKSSTMNALCGEKRVSVSKTPGKTKHFQTIYLRPNLQLCDCPGMVLPSFVHSREDLVVAGILSIDSMHDCIAPIRVVCEQIPYEVLCALYGVSPLSDIENKSDHSPSVAHTFLGEYAKLRGFMTARGNPHYDRAARIVLKDYVKGRLRFCHPPPNCDATTYQEAGLPEGDFMVQDRRLLSYVEPMALGKLLRYAEKARKQAQTTIEPSSEVMLKFDLLALGQAERPAVRHFRSNKKLYASSTEPTGEECDVESVGSSSSAWSSVSSAGSVGGTSLLSGVPAHSTPPSACRKPWRQMAAIKREHLGISPLLDKRGAKRTFRKKEKLRRLYADLDKHED